MKIVHALVAGAVTAGVLVSLAPAAFAAERPAGGAAHKPSATEPNPNFAGTRAWWEFEESRGLPPAKPTHFLSGAARSYARHGR
jgi:hypothetical protein